MPALEVSLSSLDRTFTARLNVGSKTSGAASLTRLPPFQALGVLEHALFTPETVLLTAKTAGVRE
jgi:hypothetical protein